MVDDVGKVPAFDDSRLPCVAQHHAARDWMEVVAATLAPKTVSAYGLDLEEYLAFCEATGVAPESDHANLTHVTRYLKYLRARPSASGPNVVQLGSAAGLSAATLARRMVVVRLFHEHLVTLGARSFSPVPRSRIRLNDDRGRHTHGRRAIFTPPKRLPWIPDNPEWARFARVVSETGTMRDVAMLAFEYAAALRVEELCSIALSDLDMEHGLLTVVGKGSKPRVIPLLPSLLPVLERYLVWRAEAVPGAGSGALFVSESNRNFGGGLGPSSWQKRVRSFALAVGLPRMTTHTFRHLCLTDLARQGWEIERIACFAGHSWLSSTRIYIHLAASDMSEKFAGGMVQINAWRSEMLNPVDRG